MTNFFSCAWFVQMFCDFRLLNNPIQVKSLCLLFIVLASELSPKIYSQDEMETPPKPKYNYWTEAIHNIRLNAPANCQCHCHLQYWARSNCMGFSRPDFGVRSMLWLTSLFTFIWEIVRKWFKRNKLYSLIQHKNMGNAAFCCRTNQMKYRKSFAAFLRKTNRSHPVGEIAKRSCVE